MSSNSIETKIAQFIINEIKPRLETAKLSYGQSPVPPTMVSWLMKKEMAGEYTRHKTRQMVDLFFELNKQLRKKADETIKKT